MKKGKIAENFHKQVDNLANQVEKKLGKISATSTSTSASDSDQTSRYVPPGGYGPQYQYGAGYQQYHPQQPLHQPPVAYPYMQQQQVPRPFVVHPQPYPQPYAPPISPQMTFVPQPQLQPQLQPAQQNQSPLIYQQPQPQPPLHNQHYLPNQQSDTSSSQSDNKFHMSPPPTLPPHHANADAMANAGYENASTSVKAESGPSPMIPPQTANNNNASARNPTTEEMHNYIIKTSSYATLKTCGILGVQPWFCSLRQLPSGGGISEEYHCDLRSLLTANFRSISMPVSSAAELQIEFENRNSQLFTKYTCEIRHQHPTVYAPAVLIETFGNYHEMLQVYYKQSLRYMKAVNSQANRHLGYPRRDDVPGGCTSLKFAIVSDGKMNLNKPRDKARQVERKAAE